MRQDEKRQRHLIGAAFLLGLSSLFISGSACEPCVQLSNMICDCEPTANAQLACRQEREVQRSQREASQADPEICAAAMETCTCKALAENDWEACGMSRDSLPDAEAVQEGDAQ